MGVLKVTKNEYYSIRKKYKNGEKISALMEKYGVSENTIRNYTKDIRVNRIKRLTSEQIEQIKKEYSEGIRRSILSLKYSISVDTVSKYTKGLYDFKNFNTTDYDAVIEDYKNGMKGHEICEKHLIDIATVYRILRRNGIERNRGHLGGRTSEIWNEENLHQLKFLHKYGSTDELISSMLKIPVKKIRMKRIKLGLKSNRVRKSKIRLYENLTSDQIDDISVMVKENATFNQIAKRPT